MKRRARLLLALSLITPLLVVAASGEEVYPTLSKAERGMIASMSLSALPPLPPDPTNRYADQPGPAAFGATLFFERRLSRDGAVACATCHVSDRQFQDDKPRAIGVAELSRRTMPLGGVARNQLFFWDGRRDSLWAQALTPLENPLEHAGNRTAYSHFVAEHLRGRYEHIFGPLPDLTGLPQNAGPLGDDSERRAWANMSNEERDSVDTVFVNLGKAIAAFERTIVPEKTRFDRFADALSGGEPPSRGEPFTDQEIDGLKLFIGEARCSTCHSGPRFTDGRFHNTGVPVVSGLAADLGRQSGIDALSSDPFNCLGRFRDGEASVCVAQNDTADATANLARTYKTPSLRGAAARPPYMHAGQLSSLEAVVDHYAQAPASPNGLSELKPVVLAESERKALVAFLKTLSN